MKGLKLGPIVIFKRKSIEKYLSEIDLIIKSQKEKIRLGHEIMIDIIETAEERIKSIEQGIIKSMQEQK